MKWTRPLCGAAASIGNTKPLFTPTLWSLPAPRQRPPSAPGSHPSASPEYHLGTLAGSQPGGPRSESARCHSQRRRQLACSRPSPSPARRWQRETGKFFGMDANASDEEPRRRAPDHPVCRHPHGSPRQPGGRHHPAVPQARCHETEHQGQGLVLSP